MPAAGPWLFGLALVALPFVSNDFIAYQIALFLIYGIATQGVALCWGRLGFLPLGHALFFGLGAYLAGGTLKAAQLQPAWYAALPLALLLPAALAYLTARLVFARSHRSGPFFSLITLAMTMLGFLAAQQWSAVTGGFNGMADIPELPGTERYSSFYWVVAACALCTTLLLGGVLRRRWACCGAHWRRTKSACSSSAMPPTASRPWHSLSPRCSRRWPACCSRCTRASSRR
jgi:branched-chain amino acid transport system permease protein